MLKSQRILVFTGLLVLAWLLHVLLCDWVIREPYKAESRIITWNHGPILVGGGVANPEHFTGLCAFNKEGRGVAVVFGIVLPLALIGTDIYLLLGWRHQARLDGGLCPQCGYDLRGAPPEAGAAPGRGCPECGWNRGEHGAAGDEDVQQERG
jgi:hypothetical protein